LSYFEHLIDDFSNVAAVLQPKEKAGQLLQLVVLLIVIVRKDRYSVAQLKTEGKGSVVNQNNIRQLAVRQNIQVLNKEPLLRQDTVLAK